MQTRKGGVLFVLFILAIAGFVITNIKNGFNISQAEALQSRGNVLYVGGSGPNNYSKIQDAIDNASNGDTIFVYSGVYYEHVTISKTINLIGEDKSTTIIDGSNSGNVIGITADGVNISCFTIQNSAYTGISIYYAQHCDIENIIVTNHPEYGINLYNSSNCIIADVNVSNNSGYGISLYKSINCIIANATTNNNWGGIYVVYSSNNCTIINTTASNNEWCFYLYNSHNCTVVNAIITNSNDGITLSESSNCTITNTFIRNNNKGIWLDLSSNNLIYNNYFNNTVNALDNGYNTWNISKTLGENIIWGAYLGGNYWNDYNGEDTDGDGIGNTNVPYNCGGNIIYGGDFLPLTDSIPTPPRWKNQGQSNSTVERGKSIILSAQGKDNVALNWAWLATNETGEWQNFPRWIEIPNDIWNESWLYYKKLYIENPISDYQMMITVYKEDGHDDILNATVDCENHCNENFSDIRFVANDSITLLPYWIESMGTENGHHYARIWVKTSGDESIYMLYGNENAKPVSNGTATFPALFYDMSYDSTNDWNYTVAVGDSSHRTHHWVNDFNDDSTLSGARLRYRYKLNSIDSRYWASRAYIGLTSGNGTDVYPWGTIDETNSIYIENSYNTDAGAIETQPSCRFYSRNSHDNVSYSNRQRISGYSEGNYYIGEISFCSSMAKYKLWRENYTPLLKEWQLTSNIPSSVNKQFFAGGPHNTGNSGIVFEWNSSSNYLRWKYAGSHFSDTDSWIEYYFYWVFIAKYADPEPSWTGKYGSPMKMQENNEWQWSNFTWGNPSIPAGTKVGWRIYYMDTSGNINCTDIMSFVVTPDVTSPEIKNIQDYPDPQVENKYVNITCNVTDNVAVNVVKVNITYPDGSFVNVTMLHTNGTNTYYYNSTYSIAGIYSYFIWANDTNGKINFTNISTFIIYKLNTISTFGDGSNEKTIQLGSFGNNENNGGTDDSSIYIKIPKHTHIINASMTIEGLLSNEGCFAWDDGSGSWVTSNEEGYWQSFTMKAYKITKIEAYYHAHRTNWYYYWWYFHTKLYDEQNNYISSSYNYYEFYPWYYNWYGWATASYDEILEYNSVYLLKAWGTGPPNVDYVGWYYDMYGYYGGGHSSFNPNHDFNFEVYGKSYPFNVKIDVGDDGDVEWTSGTSDWFTTQETVNGWEQELQEYIDNAIPDENGNVTIPIKITTDRYGKIRLSNLSIYYNFLSQLSNESVTPRYGRTNQTFTFNVTYLNKDGLPPTFINVNISKQGWFLNESMNYVNGDYTTGALFTYSTTLSEEGGYQYSFWATDGIGASYIGPFLGPAVGNDTTAPQIFGIQANPNPQFSGGCVNISCNVTDNLLLDKVFINITYPDGSHENFSITQNKTGNTYYCKRIYPQVGTYYYYIWVNDFWNNQNASNIYSFNIISGNVIWVDDDFDSSTPGWGIDHFNKIQDGINASTGEETIFVYNGIYNEIVNVSKPSIVYGESNDKTILYGGFILAVDNITITNFNITGGYAWDPDGLGKNGANRVGVYIMTSNNTLLNNRICDIKGGGGDNGSQYHPDGGDGGIAAGVYIDSVTFYNNIFSNIIFSIVGGKGGDGYSIYPGGKGGKGGKSIGIYVKYSKYTNISFNKISNIIGGDGGIGKFYCSGGSGSMGIGITIEYYGNNNINSNIISEINGGNGGNGGYVSPGSNGGNGIGIYIQSRSNSISSNTITVVNGGRGGKGGYYCGGKGGMGIGIYINDSLSIFNNVTSNLIHSIKGGYGFGEYGSACDGGNGGEGIGLYLLSCESNSIYSNNISSITGGTGGMGDPSTAKKGGDGGVGSGIYISNSNSNDINLNNISNITGGRGGTGFSGTGASGGLGSGVYIYDSNFNNISLNNISFIKGGEAGSSIGHPGGEGGIGSGIYLFISSNNNISYNDIAEIYGGGGGPGSPSQCGGIGAGIYFSNSVYNNISYCNFYEIKGGIGGHGYYYDIWPVDGANQVGFGFYLENDSFENNIDSSNIVDGDPVLFYYNKTGLIIENFHLTADSNPTNLGKIVLISCTNFTIRNNTIANFVGESGKSNKFTGENGSIGSGIYIYNSDLNTIVDNTIFSIRGGKGGTGGLRGQSGNGGISSAIWLINSSYNTISSNGISYIYGGIGGRGCGIYVTRGENGVSIGICFINSIFNNISNLNLSHSKLKEGIRLCHSYNNNILNCIVNNSEKGVFLLYSVNNSIFGCKIENNLFGIIMYSSSNNIIYECNFYRNKNTGIYLYNYSNNNYIYHNNFMNTSGEHVWDECINNYNLSYPIGGNYWYSGFYIYHTTSPHLKDDFYQGKKQDIPGGDRIKDIPHNISGGNNKDNYPLMFPTYERVIYVGNTFPDDPINHTWNTIQEGINDANSGDTIIIYNGTYHENIFINKSSIDLVGVDELSTFINGNENGSVLYVVANDVHIIGLTITHSGNLEYDAGVYVYSNDTTIRDCNIKGNCNGIYADNCQNLSVRGCNIFANVKGIFFNNSGKAVGSTVELCNIYNISNEAIYLKSSTTSSILRCNIHNSTTGIFLNSSSNIGIGGCRIHNVSLYGINLYNSSNNHIYTNTLFNNVMGVHISCLSNNNFINDCNFIDNTQHAYDECNNQWDLNMKGNYWGDYTDSDNDLNGKWDHPYTISGGSSKDGYPKMLPGWGKMVYVGRNFTDNPSNHIWNSIQDGINDTCSSTYYYNDDDVWANLKWADTIYVFCGIYPDENLSINNDYIKLIGEDKNFTVLEGGSLNLKNAHGITISNFTIKNGTGIEMGSFNILKDCIVAENIKGIRLHSNCLIKDCTISNNKWTGIYFEPFSKGNKIRNCKISNHFYAGIYMKESNNNTVTQCDIWCDKVGGLHGIYISKQSNNNAIYSCNITGCSYGVYILNNSNNNVFYKNNFLSFPRLMEYAYDECSNNWDYSGIGNYWENYINFDDDYNGKWDEPYNVSGGINKDNYPLMLPYPHNFIYVDDDFNDDPINHTWNTVQEGINDAKDGDTVSVLLGIYNEEIKINKSINLIGAGTENTIIDGGGSKDIIVINKDSVNVTGFTLQNGIYGIRLNNSSHIHILNCRIINMLNGIGLYSSDNLISHCKISYSNDGIKIISSSNNTVIHSTITNNHNGIKIISSNSNQIHQNNITSNENYGIYALNCTVNATLNWWGDISGPSGSGSGTGDSVSNNVLFTPWRITPVGQNQPPSIVINNPKNGQSVKGKIIITGNSTDLDGVETIDKVEVKIGSGSWKKATGTTSWQYSWNTNKISNGYYQISARVWDGFEYGYSSLMVCVNNYVNKKPTVSITYPTGGTVSGTITIAGAASDNKAVKKVEVKIGSGSWKKATGTTSWQYSWDTTTLSNGYYTIHARSLDYENAYSKEKSVIVKVQNTPPKITEVNTYYNGFFLKDIDIVNTYTAIVTAGSGGDIERVEFTMCGGGKSRTIKDYNAPYKASFNMGDFGIYPTLEVVAYSESGQASQTYKLYPTIIDTPDWLEWLVNHANPNIKTVWNGGKRYWKMEGGFNLVDIDYTVQIPSGIPIIGGKWGVDAYCWLGLKISSSNSIYASGSGYFHIYLRGDTIGVDMDVNVLLKVNENTREIEWKSATITIYGDGKVTIFSIELDLVIVEVFKVDIYIEYNVAISITFAPTSSGGNIIPGLSFTGLSGNIYLGPGISVTVIGDAAGFEGGGGGRFDFTIYPKLGVSNFQLCAHGKAWIGWWTVWEASGCWPNRVSSIFYLPLPLNRDNSSAYENYTWIPGKTDGTIVENVYPFSHPSLALDINLTENNVSRIDNQMIVWVWDDINKNEIKGLELKYSLWENDTKTWSIPKPITNDSLRQMDPVLEFDEKGNAICVFEEINNESLTNSTPLSEVYKDDEIAYMVWNKTTGNWSGIKLITNNTFPDFSPKLTSDIYGNIALLWIRDMDSNLSTFNDRQVFYSEWDGEKWVDPIQLINNYTFISTPSITRQNDKVAICLSVDTDGNLSTFNDREIYYKTCDTSINIWTPLIKLTSDYQMDESPSIAYNPDGNLSIAWIKYNASKNNNSIKSLCYGFIQNNSIKNVTIVNTGNILNPEIISFNKPVITWQDMNFLGAPSYATYENNSWRLSRVGKQSEFHSQLSWRMFKNDIFVVDVIAGLNTTSESDLTYITINGSNISPISNFTYSPQNPDTQKIVHFNDLSLDLNGDIVGWLWDFGDGEISYDRNATHQFTKSGLYNVTLIVWDDDYAMDQITKTLIVSGVSPTANFSYEPSLPSTQSLIFFTDSSNDVDGSIVSWNWSLGDGNFSTLQNVVHKYEHVGIYNVTLTVTDDDDMQDTCYVNIEILNYPPEANFTCLPDNPKVGDSIQFVDLSADRDGDITAWYWEFGDGDVSNEKNPIHQFSSDGIYIVNLTVTDDFGYSDRYSKTVTIFYSELSPPKITNLQTNPDIQETNGYINISCKITDNTEVDIVKINIIYPNNNTTIFTLMNHVNNTHIYYYNTTYSLPGEYQYQVWTCDIFENENISSVQTFEINIPNVAPVANFSWNPLNPTDLDVINFTDLSNDSDGFITNWTWNFGDGAISYEQNPQHQYADDGIYNVTLIVTDDDGATDSITKQINVSNVAPVANFSWNPLNPTDLDIISFTDLSNDSDGFITNWTWNFGDGAISYQQNPTHQYSDDGTYNVTLTVTDNDGETNSTTKQIVVLNVPPIANFSYLPLNPTDLDIISFTDLSNDSDGFITNWTWNFGDGNISYEENPSHQYADDGIYNVNLTVTDDDGAINSTTKQIIVSNVPPIANFSYLPENPTDMDTIQFTDLSCDSDGTIVNWTWNFGDGNISYEENPSHQYADDGIYNVNLTVTDDDGAINSTTKQIIVSNVPPIANFSYLPENPVTTMPVYFTDSSYDLDGNIVSWFWGLGDGKESNIQNPSHQYSHEGIYVVNLTVWDDDGANASITKNITVIKPATDYILITFSTKNDIFDYNISTNFSFIACASAFNNTYGFIEFADANWSITNYGSNGTINASHGKSILFDSGWNDGTAILTAECNNFNDSVVFNINSGLFSFLLNQGWDLITLPCENEYNASSLYNAMEGCSIILSWNASMQDFEVYVPGSPYDFAIEDGHGYFIGMKNDSIFSLVDTPIENVSIPLYIGWNILGWFKSTPTNASTLLNSIQGCNIVLRWSANIQDFELYVPGANDFVITRGDGFLVAVDEQSIWHGEG
ncbi:MAG TPA: DUF2341 domain-containing protein [Thermoplasmatales archaeon]|nr:DUF2341 domain-containing protein [Thermoplasmatales archaeon]